ncbi:quinolinate synthase NadA [Neorickettsia sennetsu]|uniref:Quinolinate synthase n=1 Tax=Ehrlichia sennetsu (strain ATCC VR-367 / Miyayama) TaxID=222891 RepID=Q2GCG3_EHRS3|nr:quinolinate synthase NadA [Neorickettsia sennetsu]ABD45626.1 quinolinate synthetase complex, subunit A [Neorickettsia sennetsu str. Miyayama]
MGFLKNLEREIVELKKKKNAVILAHYYQDDELQDIADFVGDSLDLSKKASNTDAEIIVFCGVTFMGEVAKLLSPGKKVIVPDMAAGCSLEDSCKVEHLKKFISPVENPFVLTYINSSVHVKAISDSICTSSSAEKIINSIPKEKNIVFAPDKFLGSYLQKRTGRKMKIWQGTCIVHESFSEKHAISLKLENPDAKVVAHPECPDVLIKYADFVGSTSQILSYIKKSGFLKFIVLTEPGIIHQAKKILPHGIFFPVESVNSSGTCAMCNKCPHMRLNTMEKLYHCLDKEEPSIEIDPSIFDAARSAVENMFFYLNK